MSTDMGPPPAYNPHAPQAGQAPAATALPPPYNPSAPPAFYPGNVPAAGPPPPHNRVSPEVAVLPGQEAVPVATVVPGNQYPPVTNSMSNPYAPQYPPQCSVSAHGGSQLRRARGAATVFATD